MISHLHSPGPPLSRFVELFWYYAGVSLPHKQERLLPQGTVELVIDLRDCRGGSQRLPDAVVSGPHSRFFVLDTACQSEVIGIHFKPGGAFPFFKLPVDELHNLHVALDDLWGACSVELRERVLAAPTPSAKIEVMERFLAAQAIRGFDRHPAVGFALGEFQRAELPAIGAVTDKIGLSSRRFIEVFSEEVGLSPKLFCRVQRFQQVLKIVRREHEVDWAEIALGCGYFDQAHFIHDFKEFSGINPTAYLAAMTDHLNHVPICE
jgi:AraC-like DNA-binding protein